MHHLLRHPYPVLVLITAAAAAAAVRVCSLQPEPSGHCQVMYQSPPPTRLVWRSLWVVSNKAFAQVNIYLGQTRSSPLFMFLIKVLSGKPMGESESLLLPKGANDRNVVVLNQHQDTCTPCVRCPISGSQIWVTLSKIQMWPPSCLLPFMP